jgi:hypothetical protein
MRDKDGRGIGSSPGCEGIKTAISVGCRIADVSKTNFHSHFTTDEN